MASQLVVVVYDISNDRRRTRLHDRLLGYGSPVQYSVFECLLDQRRLAEMKKLVRKTIHPRSDHVRYYFLCQACAARTVVTSGPAVLAEVQAIIV